jgi:hypothetical protein
MARFMSRDKETCTELAHEAWKIPRALKLTPEQGLECIGATGMPSSMMDAIGAYFWRAIRFNPFPSWRWRTKAREVEVLELVKGDFFATVKDKHSSTGTRVTALSFAIAKDAVQALVDRTIALQNKSMLLWEHCMDKTSTRCQLLLDKGGEHVTLCIIWYNLLFANSPQNVLVLGTISGSGADETFDQISLVFGNMLRQLLSQHGNLTIDLPAVERLTTMPTYDLLRAVAVAPTRRLAASSWPAAARSCTRIAWWSGSQRGSKGAADSAATIRSGRRTCSICGSKTCVVYLRRRALRRRREVMKHSRRSSGPPSRST